MHDEPDTCTHCGEFLDEAGDCPTCSANLAEPCDSEPAGAEDVAEMPYQPTAADLAEMADALAGLVGQLDKVDFDAARQSLRFHGATDDQERHALQCGRRLIDDALQGKLTEGHIGSAYGVGRGLSWTCVLLRGLSGLGRLPMVNDSLPEEELPVSDADKGGTPASETPNPEGVVPVPVELQFTETVSCPSLAPLVEKYLGMSRAALNAKLKRRRDKYVDCYIDSDDQKQMNAARYIYHLPQIWFLIQE